MSSKKNEKWFCILCISEIITICSKYNREAKSSILTKPTEALIDLNNHLPDNLFNNLPDCKHRDNLCFRCLLDHFKTKSFSLFHLNIRSLQKNFEDFYTLLFELDTNFDITAVTESRI